MTARALFIPRNIDAKPSAGVELSTSVYGNVPNDGAPHLLATPAGMAPFVVNPVYQLRVGWVRVEWSTLDPVVPPPLTLSLLIDGSASVDANALTRLMLQAIALGTPAIEAPLYTRVRPNAHVSVQVTNTGTVAQLVSAYLWGWAFPDSLEDGADYGNN